jgi:hypothetical protein
VSSLRKQFLSKVIELSGPLSNTDIHDVGCSALGLTLEDAEAIARELEDLGLIQVIGLGGNIAITAAGRKAALDSDWE